MLCFLFPIFVCPLYYLRGSGPFPSVSCHCCSRNESRRSTGEGDVVPTRQLVCALAVAVYASYANNVVAFSQALIARIISCVTGATSLAKSPPKPGIPNVFRHGNIFQLLGLKPFFLAGITYEEHSHITCRLWGCSGENVIVCLSVTGPKMSVGTCRAPFWIFCYHCMHFWWTHAAPYPIRDIRSFGVCIRF